jgi:hypothetical protein
MNSIEELRRRCQRPLFFLPCEFYLCYTSVVKTFLLENRFGHQLGVAVRPQYRRPLPLKSLGKWIKDLPPPPASATPAPEATSTPPANVVAPVIPGCPEMTNDQYMAKSQEVSAAYNASGKTTVTGFCAVVRFPDGTIDFRQECHYPNGNTGGADGDPNSFANTGVTSCEENWANICKTMKAGDPGYDKCPGAQAAPEPAPTPQPEPPPVTPPAPPPVAPQPTPVSVNIQASTPGYGIAIPYPVYRQPYAAAQQPAPAKQASAPVTVKLPEQTQSSDLVNVGLAAALVAAVAFGLSRLK